MNDGRGHDVHSIRMFFIVNIQNVLNYKYESLMVVYSLFLHQEY